MQNKSSTASHKNTGQKSILWRKIKPLLQRTLPRMATLPIHLLKVNKNIELSVFMSNVISEHPNAKRKKERKNKKGNKQTKILVPLPLLMR